MDRCPNCDATVRPNAKFCTSCGFRLPNPEPAKQPSEWRSPFATTSNYEHNQSWTAPVPPPPAPIPSPEPVIAAPAPAVESMVEPTRVDDAAPVFAGWPSFTTTIHDTQEHDAGSEPSVADLAHADAAAAETDAAPTKPAEPEWPSLDHLFAEAQDEPDETETNAPPEAAPVVEAAAGEAGSPGDPTEPIPALNTGQPTGGVERALGLVDELRSLITTLGAPVATGGADAGVGAILAGAGAGAADSDELTQLREAIATANSRPRDIDVMLDLVSRAGVIQTVLTERDRFSAAITSALAALNNHPE